MKNKIKCLVATAGLSIVGIASAVPVSIEPIVEDVSAQATSVITEALPFLAVVLGGVILYKMVRKFVR